MYYLCCEWEINTRKWHQSVQDSYWSWAQGMIYWQNWCTKHLQTQHMCHRCVWLISCVNVKSKFNDLIAEKSRQLLVEKSYLWKKDSKNMNHWQFFCTLAIWKPNQPIPYGILCHVLLQQSSKCSKIPLNDSGRSITFQLKHDLLADSLHTIYEKYESWQLKLYNGRYLSKKANHSTNLNHHWLKM